MEGVLSIVSASFGDLGAPAAVIFLRVGAAMAMLPIFGERSVPVRIRLALSFAFTLVLLPVVGPGVAGQISDGLGFGRVLGSEVVVGLAFGVSLRLVVLALQMAGTIAAQSTSLSQMFGGGAVEAQPAIGHVLLVGGLALAAISGLHVQIAQSMIMTYDVFPAGKLPLADQLATWGISQVMHSFRLAFSLAAPFVLASFLYNLTLGVINRAMPQLMVVFVGAPAITAAGLVLLALSFPSLLRIWLAALGSVLHDPFGG